jgi:hypothetical protein
MKRSDPEYVKEYRKRNVDKLRAQGREFQTKWLERDPKNKEYAKEACRLYRLNNPERFLWLSAKKRAKKRAKEQGLPFNVTVADIVIPSHCPVLGIELVRGDYNTAPSLDKIVPALGYVKGNVAVISKRANMIKSNANAEELSLVLEYVKRVTP